MSQTASVSNFVNMDLFRLVGLVFAVTLSIVTLTLCEENLLDLKDKPRNLIPVSRLREMVERVNSLATTWEAEVPESWIEKDATLLDLDHLTGTFNPSLVDKSEFKIQKVNNNDVSAERDDDDDDDDDDSDDDDDDHKKDEEEKAVQCENNGLPKSFDAREKWPKCKSTISHIYDQGNCGSCWATSAVAAFTDRLCIQSNGKHTELRSVQQVLSCCHKGAAKNGCNGGWPIATFDYIRRNGLSTGGDYDSKQGCQPYRIKPCAHVVNSTKLKSCSSYPMETAHKCKLHCYNDNYKTPFKKDRIKGVYQYTTGNIHGWHAVRVIGWGEEKGTPYWLATNSWNDLWGDKGYFKIIRDNPGNGFFQETIAACIVDV